MTGLPIKLHDGSIAAVTARIPWPNPLTSTLGLSVQSLHLTFHLVPIVSEPIVFSATNLADSVASVAETFIHDELTPREEATLRESFHPDLAYDHSRIIPGSMDPFLHATDDEEFHSDVDPDGVSIFATLIERLLARFEFDAVDTKITIIHPEHASFVFSIAEVRYGTEDFDGQGHESHDTGAESTEKTSGGETRRISISGLTLTARDLRPPTLPSPTSLTPSTASPTSPKVSSRLPGGSQLSHRSPSVSPTSSSSSLDEDTQLLMSQSLAYLPPRSIFEGSSSSISITSNLYQSAVSTITEAQHASSCSGRTPSPVDHNQHADTSSSHFASDYDGPAVEADLEPEEEMILSFGAESIVIRLTTPPLSMPAQDQDSSSRQQPPAPAYDRPSQGSDQPIAKQSMKLSFSAGVAACAFRAWHIRGVLDIVDAWGSHHTPSVSVAPSSASTTADTIFALGLNANMKMRGVVILLLPPKTFGGNNSDKSLDSFFTRPLVPPRLAHGCVRIFLDSLSTSCSLSSSAMPADFAAPQSNTRTARTLTMSTTNVAMIAVTLNDISAFALLAISKSARHDADPSASPILITDQGLLSQYHIAHVRTDSQAKSMDRHCPPQLPEFAILDWTKQTHEIHSTKISAWRTKTKPITSKRRDSQTRVGVGLPLFPSSPTSDLGSRGPQHTHVPAITLDARFILSSSKKGQSNGRGVDEHVEVDMAPLHFFVDLGLALGGDNVLAFLDDVVSSRKNLADCSRSDDEERDHDEEHESTLPVAPEEQYKSEREAERQRLERLVLEDLDLDLDYRDNRPAKGAEIGEINSISRYPRTGKVDPNLFIAISLLVIHIFALLIVYSIPTTTTAGNRCESAHGKAPSPLPTPSFTSAAFGSHRT